MEKKAKKHVNSLIVKLVLYIITVILAITGMIMVLYQIQTRGQEEYQKKMSLIPLLEEVTKELDLKAESVDTLTKRFHSSNQTTVRLVELFMRSGAFKELQEASDTITAAKSLRSLSENTGLYSMFIADTAGNMQLMDNVDIYLLMGEDFRYNLIKTDANPSGVFTPEQYAQITAHTDGWEGTSRTTATGEKEYAPVHAVVTSESGTYNGYYYSAPFLTETGEQTGYYLIAMADSDKMDNDIVSLTSISTVLSDLGVGNTGIVFSLDPETGDFSYFEDKNGIVLTGENYRRMGMTDEILSDGYSGLQSINGTTYYCVSKHYTSDVFGDCVVIVASLPEEEMYASRTSNVFWSVLVFFLVGNLILTYAVVFNLDQIRKGTIFEARRKLFTFRSGKQVFFNSVLARRIGPLLIVGLIVILGMSIFTQTLSQLSSAVTISESRIASIGVSTEKNSHTSETITEVFETQNLYKTRLLADILKRTPSLAFDYDLNDAFSYEYAKDSDNNPVLDNYGNPIVTGRYVANLQALCDAYGLSSIYVFNDKGRVVATNKQWWNFVLSDDPESQSYPFRDVLVNSDYYIQELQTNDVGEIEQYIGCAYYYYTYNDNGTTRFASEYEYKNGVTDDRGRVIVKPSQITRHRGLIQTGVSYQNLEDVITMATLKYTLDGMNMFYEGFFMGFAADEEHTVLYSPFSSGDVIPKREGMFNGTFNGYLTIEGEKYFSSIRKVGDIYIGTAIPTRTLFSLRNNIATATVIFSFVAFVMLLGYMVYSNSNEDEMIKARLAKQKEEEEADGPAAGSANFDVKMPDGQKKRVKSASSRWSKSYTAWMKKSVEQKFSFVLSLCLMVFFILFLAALAFSDYLFKDKPIIQYILKGDLERLPNMFTITRAFVIIAMVLFVAKVVQKFINVLTVNLGARAETVGHLLESFIKYGGVIGAFFYALYLVGFNTGSLLTSAGILSIVIGLGAQSLISDILAGIFIVFEGEFRAGDIVTVGDFRGTVLEIGIRTTKIEDFLGNIKIYNNSSISGVLNMTKEYSTVPTIMSIEYGESLERVEAVLQEEFPAIKKKLKTIISGPFYKGVHALGESSVDILIVSQCLEGDRIQLQRDLNRELYLVFNKHHINVPFPQVTLSYLNEGESNTATKKETKAAEEFIKEQKEASVHVDYINQ